VSRFHNEDLLLDARPLPPPPAPPAAAAADRAGEEMLFFGANNA